MTTEPLALQPSPADPQPVRVYKLDDCTWWAGYSLKQCIEQALKEEWFSETPRPLDSRECTADEMQRLTFVDWDDEPQGDNPRTFAAELQRRIEAGEQFPQLFASTEC